MRGYSPEDPVTKYGDLSRWQRATWADGVSFSVSGDLSGDRAVRIFTVWMNPSATPDARSTNAPASTSRALPYAPATLSSVPKLDRLARSGPLRPRHRRLPHRPRRQVVARRQRSTTRPTRWERLSSTSRPPSPSSTSRPPSPGSRSTSADADPRTHGCRPRQGKLKGTQPN